MLQTVEEHALTGPVHFSRERALRPVAMAASLFPQVCPLSAYRARYYDQNVGRFITEDPVGFNAGPNFYRYVRNNPALFIDPTGFQATYKPPDPRDNTPVCDGHDGLRVQIGYPGTLGGPKQQKCLIDCARVHEESHIADDLAADPNVCKGKAPGVRLGYDPGTRAASEIKASNAELDCLWKEYHNGCKDCKQIVLDRIGDVEAYRDSFKKKP
jgi:RHS repeat-associated protein